ncbi:MAG: DUF6691 family protein [Granulosicoccaceae bacterium]
MRLAIAFAAGAVFSLGLLVSGMANPAKVINFLDVTGSWDPSLAFVMIGAIAVVFPAFKLIKDDSSPLAAEHFEIPTRRDVDKPLVIGAALFGVGWGLSGYCPGPAVVSVVVAWQPMLAFFPAMLVGMWLARRQG